MQKHRVALNAIEKQFGVPATASCWRSGAARPTTAAIGCPTTPARGGDAGLCRPAQGPVPRRIHPRAEDARRGRGARAGCARPGPAPPGSRSSCRRNITSTASISTATAGSISGLRCRMRLLQAAKQLANKGWQARRALGLRGESAGQCRLHHGRARVDGNRSPSGCRRRLPCAGAMAASPAPTQSQHQPRCWGPRAPTARPSSTPKNYFVIKDHNFSDLCVLFVGHLAIA